MPYIHSTQPSLEILCFQFSPLRFAIVRKPPSDQPPLQQSSFSLSRMSSASSTSVKETMNRQQHQQQEQQASGNTMKGEETKTSLSKKKIWSLKKLKNNKKVKSLQAVLTSSPFRWKTVKVMGIHRSFVDNVVFKVVSVCEGVVLVSTVCFFFLCCGCHV